MMKIKVDFRIIALTLLTLLGENVASARPYRYPSVRYQNAESHALGGVSVPLVNELGNDLFNNPAALAKNTKFRAEYLNLNLEANSRVLGNLGFSTPKMMGLGGLTSELNSKTNQVFGAGFGNLTAFSWGGLGVGLLFQERVRATSDGTNVDYETVSQLVPAVGYGFSLARGVVRVGYSLQYVIEASGRARAVSDASASFLSGIKQGWGLSHNASVNFTFPFTYLPTFSLMARNIGGMHFIPGGILQRAKNATGTPNDEPMSFDAAFNYMVRMSGSFKSLWYLQFKDFTASYGMSLMERVGFGADFSFTPQFSLRAGFTGSNPSFGLGYRSESAEINLSYFNEPVPFSGVASNETRYALQYKVFFQDKNARNRDEESQRR